MRYLVDGYYGMRNAGDDILLYVAIDGIARVDPEATFSVISSVPLVTPPDARVTVIRNPRRFETVRQLFRNDVWLFGGGGLLEDQTSRSVREVRRLARIAAVARALGRRIALLGVGVGPLRTPAGRHAARRFLRHVDFATVRDPESAALVSALVPLTASVAADLAFLLPSVLAVPRAARTPTPTLGVSLLAYGTSLSGDVDHDEQVATCVADALDTTLRNHPSWCVRFFEFFAGTSEYRDARVLRRVAASMIDPSRVSYREYDGDFLALVPDLQACHAFLGMRFHSSVLSYLADIPFLTVEMHPKCRTALSSRIGQPEAAIVPLAALRDLEIVSRALDRLVSNPAALRPSVDSRQLVRAASDTFDQFRRRFTSRPALAEVAAPRLLGRFIRGARH